MSEVPPPTSPPSWLVSPRFSQAYPPLGLSRLATILLHILIFVGRPALTGKAPVRKGSPGCFSFLWHILRLIRVSPGSPVLPKYLSVLDLGNEDLLPTGNCLKISPPNLVYLGKVQSGLS